MARHRITDPDPETKTGHCSECGPVAVYRGTCYGDRQYWRCGVRSLTYSVNRYRDGVDVGREAQFLRAYGITIEEYDRLLAEQHGACRRCLRLPKPNVRLAVDHDHLTGRVRGLLCGPCNTYLGRLEANMDRLQEDMAYLASEIAKKL